MTVRTASGTQFYIGTSALIDDLADIDEWESKNPDWTLIGEVEDMGEYGDESTEVTFAAIGDGRIRRSKGARDAGSMQVVVGRDPEDEGQSALRQAQTEEFDYNFKVIFPDRPNENYSPTIHYFRGLVMSAREQIGQNDNIIRTQINVGINTEVIEVPVALLPSP
jgi:hypothetical protein